jgi:hypothetical protein
MISRASMKQQLKGNKMSLPKPRPKNLKKKKIGDDLISGIKSVTFLLKNAMVDL